MQNLCATSETGRLRSVIIGYPDNFHLVKPAIINETQKRYYFGSNRPTRKQVMVEFSGFKAALAQHNIEIFQPTPLVGVPDQLMTRDIGVVIGDTFVVTQMAQESRRDEWLGLQPILDKIDPQKIVKVPDGVVLEGGDVIVDNGRIFIGLSQRTEPAGVQFIASHFPEFEVVPVPLKQLADGEDVLHLDCSFVPVGSHHALIYRGGLATIPAAITEKYDLIEVTKAEQQILATNVLSISPTQLISRTKSVRVNAELRRRGLEVIELPFDAPPKTGGSFRCCSLPLWRD
ncbi:NG,NG-dimethylarginine dimethylaminohydrolase 1 [hydrothermal vent metagenome]|uniref:NG,NG-dimethylarginine dimethylaminohydrolase 1 n=1 Tax=hydrothermal vent metagenome TaxID=652676 RepID=A0A3B0VJA6_9ZZZZ